MVAERLAVEARLLVELLAGLSVERSAGVLAGLTEPYRQGGAVALLAGALAGGEALAGFF